MFEVTTYPLKDLEDEIRSEFSDTELAEVADLFNMAAPAATVQAPWVQLSYFDIPQEFLEATLSYARIAATNSPVGVNADFPPIHREQEMVLFSIPGLESHLETIHGPEIARLREAGEPERFLEGTHEYPETKEFFVAGLLACVAFAKEHNHAIVFRW
jgi:hypothetical protein